MSGRLVARGWSCLALFCVLLRAVIWAAVVPCLVICVEAQLVEPTHKCHANATSSNRRCKRRASKSSNPSTVAVLVQGTCSNPVVLPFLPPSHLRKGGCAIRRELPGVPGEERADRANKAPSPMEGAATATRGNRRPCPSIGPTLLMGCWVVSCRPDTACGVRTVCRSPGAPLLIGGAANCVPLRRRPAASEGRRSGPRSLRPCLRGLASEAAARGGRNPATIDCGWAGKASRDRVAFLWLRPASNC